MLQGEQKAKLEASSADTLFPILQPALTGIARLASQAPHTDDGHLIEFHALAARSILNKSISRRQLSLAYSINPYRGCEFACRYCYARYTHEFLTPPSTLPPISPDPTQPQPWATAFEHTIYLKQNAAWLLEQELRKIDPVEEIALGTATDPYQPIERRARITRSLLEVFARRSGYRLSIVTKSTLILRDIDLLTRIAQRNTLVLHLTITTPDAQLARLLEPRAPRPDLRFDAVRQLRQAGLTTGILCSPLLPGITDTTAAVDRMAARAAAANASFFSAQPLFLKSCSRPTYLRFVSEHFPTLLPLYEDHFRTSDFAQDPYRSRIRALVLDACRRHQIPTRSTDALLTRETHPLKKLPPSSEPPAQRRLFA